MIELTPPVEKAFLVAVDTGDDQGWTAEDSLAELANLATTAGAEVVGAEWQNRRHVDPNWYIGKGKAEELAGAKRETGFEVLIADDELSPGQQRALEELLKVKVIDRSRLILDIFAQHAQTHEGRLQVELAQLEYQLPRLTRMWTHLSRTGGGIGTRGPGESQLETDRRIIRTRIAKMKERVEHVRRQRATAARGRDRRLIPTVGIVGYTNAGKSTLLNALVGSEVARAEDKLFATLDPTSRQVKLGDGQTAIVTDTVGFIHKLPHQLVDAFRATLEEVNRADVLVEVVDAADPHHAEHRETVQTVLDELGAGDKPRLVALNKADLIERAANDPAAPGRAVSGAVLVSALTGYGIDALRAEIAALLASLWVDVDTAVPYSAGELLARVRERGTVELEYGERDVHVRGRIAPTLAGELEAVAAQWSESLRNGTGATATLNKQSRSRRPVRTEQQTCRIPSVLRPDSPVSLLREHHVGICSGAGRSISARCCATNTTASMGGEGRMADPVRRGGRGTLPDGARLTWSLAEGGRGRRWRASRVRDGRLEGTLLLEIDGAGRPARLELGTVRRAPDAPPGPRRARAARQRRHARRDPPSPVRLEPGPRAGRRRLPGRAPGCRSTAGGRHAGRGDGRTPRGRRRRRPALPRGHDPLRATRRAPLARRGGGERDRRGDRRGRRAGRPR